MTFKVVLPLLFLVPVLMIMTAPSMVMAGDDSNNANIPDTTGQGAIQVQPEDDQDDQDDQVQQQEPSGQPQCFAAPCPPVIPSGKNLAEANQVGGLGSGTVRQNAQGAVNEQYCKTVGGIGDRRCEQFANPEGQNLQDCKAIAGLGTANCVQSETGQGTGTCLSANGRPYICYTDTGVAISGSGQAGR